MRGSAESTADIDEWIRSALVPLEQESIPTAPPPPQSDIRRIGSTMSDSDEDPLAVYAEALAPSPRVRRETVQMVMRPRQMTLLMEDRPRANPNPQRDPFGAPTPPMTVLPVARRPLVAEPPPPAVFRGAIPIVLLAFGAGIFVAGLVVFVLARI